jgi:hypothetical protein
MPYEVFCEHCGYRIYTARDVKPPDYVVRKVGGRCPHCGISLSSEFTLEVEGLAETLSHLGAKGFTPAS